MRKTKEIMINDRRVVVNELTVKQIRLFWGEPLDKLMGDVGDVLVALQPFYKAAVDGIEFDELENYTPSELKLIFDAFMEVNGSFFDAAKVLEGDHPLIVKLRQAIIAELMLRYVNFYNRVIPGSSITDGVSSPPPLNATTSGNGKSSETQKP